MSDNQKQFLDDLTQVYGDLSVDGFRDVFQDEGANRSSLKQDYTPDDVSELLSRVLPSGNTVADICSGTGSLLLHYLKNHKQVSFVRCEEYSEKVIPFLLVNLAIRKIKAEVIHGDSLTREIFAVYSVDGGTVTKIAKQTELVFDVVLSNPPYSQGWNPVNDERFEGYGLAPKSKADFAFLLHGFSKLSAKGVMGAILPHGVLFRGNQEGGIRQRLLQRGEITGVIGLAPNLFLHTSIPVAILLLQKGRESTDVLFIDASKEFVKRKSQNTLSSDIIAKITTTAMNRWNVERFSHLALFEEIETNDYNLNIPRYVDTFIPEPVTPMRELLEELLAIDREIAEIEREFANMFLETIATDIAETQEHDENKRLLLDFVEKRANRQQSLKKQEQVEGEQLSLWC